MVKKSVNVGLVEDIKSLGANVERKRSAYPSHLQANSSFARFINAIPVPLFIKDRKGRYVDCNQAFADFLGITPEQIQGKTVHELWPGALSLRYHAKDLELMSHPRHQVYESQIKDKSGVRRPVLFSKNVWRDAYGKAAGLVGTFTDISDLVHLRKSHQESENKFKLIADFTHSWEYWIGPDSKLRYVSPSCEAHTGYAQGEFMENDDLLLDIIHPEDRQILAEHIGHEISAPLVESMEFRIIDRHGKMRWLSHTCQPVYNADGQFMGRRASNREITVQKLAEVERDQVTEHLRNTSNLLNTVLDAIPDVIGVQDPNHRIIRYNKAGYLFLGKGPDEVNGQKCHELIGHSSPCSVCATSEAYVTKKPAQVEKYVAELDRWLDVRAYPVLDENHQISQVIEHLRDISKQKNAEIELKEAHERLITILNSIDAHIYVADISTFEILFMNRKMIDDFDADFTGQKCHESFRNEPNPCQHCTNKYLIDPQNNPKQAYTWQCRNPITQRWYLNYDRAIKWVDGRIVKIQIATDITETKNREKEREMMQKQLLHSQKLEAIGTLSGGIAHDFNNILMGIQGRVSLMALDLDSHHPHGEHIDAIVEYIQSATDLTKQLLGISRGGKYEVRPIDINEVVAKSVTMFGRTKKEINIHTKYCDPAPVVEADQTQIEQVLLNLYVNAWQAMPEGGELFIETRHAELDKAFCKPHGSQPGRYVQISVTDTGIGMDKTTLQRAFDPFFTTKEKSRGTGLGLASAYGIIKNHGGICLVSSELGSGATFDLFLPVTDQEVHREMPIERDLVMGTETILLIDDEPMIRDVGEAMLDKLGYHVMTAESGQDALDLVESNGDTIDLVILDMIMPDMDGGKTFERIRTIRNEMPVILSSGYSLDGQANDIIHKGCNGFIQKPFDISDLSQIIRKVLHETTAAQP